MINSLITHAVCMKNGIINFEINTKICYKDKVFILNKPFESSYTVVNNSLCKEVNG